ncbi:MAG: Flp pilus assembly complex ATPase component TadA [Clostridiales bacterium]|jgi:type IV pilus assembly protein PilB|nr:Flp pilus assembly complex ATPase component TadA [Clostridiales bacterium]
MQIRTKKKLGDILVEIKMLTQEQLQKYLGMQQSSNLRLGEILIKEKVVSREQLAAILEYQYSVQFVELDDFPVDKETPKLISESMARKHVLIPVSVRLGKLVVVMADPVDFIARDDVRLVTGYDLEILMCFESDILRAIDRYYDASDDVKEAFEEIIEEQANEEEAVPIVEFENEEVARSPVVRLVNTIIRQAIKKRASDIHIEPFETSIRVRYRIDGDLRVEMNPPKASFNAIVTRIKILGGMDISEKRAPQDGRIETEVDSKKVDLRISLLPTVYGEKIVIRILDRSSIMMTKQQIGFTDHNIKLFDRIIKAPEGIILLTGPTGSGKTTTLYAVLRELNKVKTNIITAEDPVEYRLEGVNQVHINPKAGLTFASALRSMLRQDPDVIMIGEMRDTETAEIAVKAAITGHVVLSTLHTNDTVSTISRLIDMGIEPFMVSTAVVGIIAQRLVKRICENCKTEIECTEQDIYSLKVQGPARLFKGKGCDRCNNTGYKGRIGIHEILVLEREIKSHISKGDDIETLRKAAEESGLKTLFDSCRELVLEGVTTVEELLRVAYSVEE